MPQNTLTQREAAALLGVGAKWLRDRSDLFAAVRDARGRYDAASLVATFVEHRCQQAARQAARQARGADASPALERWREERARMATIQRLALERKWVPIEPVEQFHTKSADLMRRKAHKLERDFGPDARTFYEELIDDLDRLADEFFADLKNENPSEVETEDETTDATTDATD